MEWKSVKKNISLNNIKDVESKFNIKFPQDYIGCVLENNKGRPLPSTYDFEFRKEAVFSRLLSLQIEDKGNMVEVRGWIKDRLLDGIIPFADDPFGNYICFDYRNSLKPEIVFWDHEVASENKEKCLFKICNNFSDLLSKLY